VSTGEILAGHKVLTVQPSTVPRGVVLPLQGNPEAATCQTAVFAVCVYAFVTKKPKD